MQKSSNKTERFKTPDINNKKANLYEEEKTDIYLNNPYFFD